MSCPRCEGFIIREYLVDSREGFLSGFHGWRCINCGAIGDDVIRSNRQRLPPLRRCLKREASRQLFSSTVIESTSSLEQLLELASASKPMPSHPF